MNGSLDVLIDYNAWSLNHLIDFVIKNHHRKVIDKIREIQVLLHKTVKIHRSRYPELEEVLHLFRASSQDLLSHMEKEERILFPFIKKLEQRIINQEALDLPVGTLQNPLRMMMDDHLEEGLRFQKIAKLTNDYQVPNGACDNYVQIITLLKEFDDDLQKHIDLEDNVLFPRFTKLETELRN